MPESKKVMSIKTILPNSYVTIFDFDIHHTIKCALNHDTSLFLMVVFIDSYISFARNFVVNDKMFSEIKVCFESQDGKNQNLLNEFLEKKDELEKFIQNSREISVHVNGL